ncbi:MAG: OmpA family protein [Sinobacteraceae bacterium]|nr:OmpA family protein [Nevskiaceae bacterium]MBV9317838.1 OmpA family protein [Gammaproteobacteria bacterium]
MANSMMDSILGLVTPQMKQALASRLGEAPEAVHGGLGAATAATLGGLAARANDSDFLSQILGLVSGGAGHSLLGSLSSLASSGPTGTMGELVNKFLTMVFGSQQGAATGAIISQHYGLSSGSGLGLLKTAVPLVMAYFAKGQSAGTLNASALANMLRAEAPGLRSYLPGSLTSLLDNPAGIASRTATSDVPTAPYVVRRAPERTPRWLVPVAIAGALLLAWLVIRSMSGPRHPVQSAANVTTDAANSAAWAALGDMMNVKLPDGSELNVPTRGVEARLVSYLNDSSAPLSEASWFDFDRLLFDTGKATLQPASQEQLTNIATILKAYPQVKIRIGGYTDNTGDAAANLRLSEERASNVMAELIKRGIDPARIEAKGYGEENPIADNSSEEGRQKNRRISLRVTEKQNSV